MLNSKALIIIGIITTLILGFILGIMADHALGFRHRHGDWQIKEIAQEQLLARLSRKLDLTIPQIQAIGGILRLQAVKLKEARDEFRSKLKAIKEETFEKIKPHLTSEQQQKYAKLVEYHRKRWEKACSPR